MSWSEISNPELARIIPVSPPIVNKKINPIANSIGVFKKIDPSHIVATQLNILIPVGTAIIHSSCCKIGASVYI